MAQVHFPLPARPSVSPPRTPLDPRDTNIQLENGNISPSRYSSRSSSLKPTIRMHTAPSSPVSITAPNGHVKEPSFAQVNTASPPGSRNHSRQSSHDDAEAPRNSEGSVSLTDRPPSTELPRAPSRHSVKSTTSSQPQLDNVPENTVAESSQPLQYHHQTIQDAQARKAQRISQMTVQSASSGSSAGVGAAEHGTLLRPPRAAITRPPSTNTLGSELRGRLHSPASTDDHHLSPRASPRSFARNMSSNRNSPDSRPMSYIDLLNEVPYAQQIAPSPLMNNVALQGSVGSNASLLDSKKTLDMYRANVKKTNDPSIQYEFAIFMVNTAKDSIATGQNRAEDGSDTAAEMIKEARGILQKLADRTYPFAQYYLGDGYFSGFFNKDKPDYDKAFSLFVAASKHGHAEAGYRAALCYEFGWGTTKSFPKAAQFYRNAASKGHPGAATRLGKACLTNDMGLMGKQREGTKWLKRASEGADTQYNAGPYELGVLHISGFGDDVFKDEAYAAQLLTQSAELGHVDANFLMGQAYELGQLSCPKDPALSVHFYNGAAQRGMPEAMMALCAWYMVGAEPVLGKDEAEAYEWAKKAAELGMPKAEYATGYFTEMGIGCRRDPLEANVWYVRAVDSGNETAKQRLALINAAASGGPPTTPNGKAKDNKTATGGLKFWKGK